MFNFRDNLGKEYQSKITGETFPPWTSGWQIVCSTIDYYCEDIDDEIIRENDGWIVVFSEMLSCYDAGKKFKKSDREHLANICRGHGASTAFVHLVEKGAPFPDNWRDLILQDDNPNPLGLLPPPQPENKDYPPQIGVNHYNKYQIQPIAALKDCLSEEEYRGYLRGNAIKYQVRYRDKGGMEDLRKAQWYLDELLKLESGSDEKKNATYNNEQRRYTLENAINDEMRQERENGYTRR